MKNRDERKQKTMKLIRTAILNRYFIKFAVRIIVFIIVLLAYIIRKDILIEFMTHRFTFSFDKYGISIQGIRPMHVLWLMLMVMQIRHLFPRDIFTYALLKGEGKSYVEVEGGYSELEMLRFTQDMNRKSWIVLLVWLCGNAVIGFLYLMHVLDNADLLMITMFYFLSDYICILIFCPFQTFIMHNKCCVNCRIYDWGHFMMFTPMLFIRNFFSWSLFFTSIIVLLRWELKYSEHPERFWFGSNKKLQCAHCKDKTCQIKKRVNSTMGLSKNLNIHE